MRKILNILKVIGFILSGYILFAAGILVAIIVTYTILPLFTWDFHIAELLISKLSHPSLLDLKIANGIGILLSVVISFVTWIILKNENNKNDFFNYFFDLDK